MGLYLSRTSSSRSSSWTSRTFLEKIARRNSSRNVGRGNLSCESLVVKMPSPIVAEILEMARELSQPATLGHSQGSPTLTQPAGRAQSPSHRGPGAFTTPDVPNPSTSLFFQRPRERPRAAPTLSILLYCENSFNFSNIYQ